MNKTQKLLAAMLVSLGMAHGVAFAQYLNPGIENGTEDGSDTVSGPVGGGLGGNTTINSGYNDGTGLGGPTTANSGNVVIQSLSHTGSGAPGEAATVGTSLTVGPSGVRLSSGASDGPVKIQNVANGTVATDAVNYGQLMAVQQQVDTMKSGIASVAAMANIPASNDPKQRVSIGAGVGAYMGKTASAIGATVRVTKNLTAKASFSSASGGESTTGVGIAYGW